VASHAGSLVVGVSELLRHPGTRREITATAALEGLAITASRVVEGSDVEARLTLEAMSDRSLTATGSIRARWTGECRRCLATVEGDLATEVREIFEARAVEGETYPLDGDRIDLEPAVRDAVLLALPLAPLCEDTCKGPEPDAHPLGEGAVDPPDERWAALRELKFD
jgi:uncharacterized protein